MMKYEKKKKCFQKRRSFKVKKKLHKSEDEKELKKKKSK